MKDEKPATLLVVEDEFLTRLSMVDLLEARGFIVAQAANADEAISILSQNPDIRGVLTDIDMPGSMNGIDLVRVVAERWPPCRLVLVSGMKEPRREDLPARTHFIPKPVSTTALDRTLTALELTA